MLDPREDLKSIAFGPYELSTEDTKYSTVCALYRILEGKGVALGVLLPNEKVKIQQLLEKAYNIPNTRIEAIQSPNGNNVSAIIYEKGEFDTIEPIEYP